MANYTETGGWCPYCEERVMVRRRAPNHVLHLLLAICTAGLWVLVWFFSSLKVGGWRCPKCGSKASTRVPRGAKRKAAAAA